MKIGIVKLSALGDIVHSMIVLQIIKKHMQNITVDWIVEENLQGVLAYNRQIDHIRTVNLKSLKKNKLAILAEIKKIKSYGRYDLVIDLQGLIKSAIVSRLLSKNTAGFDKNALRESMAAFFYKKSFYVPYEENIIKRNCKLAALALGFEFDEQEIEKKTAFLFFDHTHYGRISKFIEQKKRNIVFILGSSWPSKVYPKEKFVTIADQFADENVLLVWGSEAERQSAVFIAARTNAKVVAKMDLNALKALISHADLVIGGDSGPTHMAWALNRKSIMIYGPTPSFRNSYAGNENVTIDCGKKIDPHDLNREDFCIQKIDAMKIVELAKKLLDG